VTGGAGFIGSNYVRMLLGHRLSENVERVIVLDALTYSGNMKNLESLAEDHRFQFVKGDIRDKQLLARLLSECDVLVNFAAESHVDRSIAGSEIFYESNVLGLLNILEQARSFPNVKIVHIGTDEVYGSIDSGSWDESAPLAPNSPYSASKAAAEHLVRAFHNTYGTKVSSTRCSNNYGPYQHPEKLIPLFITNAIQGKSLPLYGSGQNKRDWLHVDDHCRGIQIVVEKGTPGESYNIGGGVELSNIQITEKILQALNKDWDLVVNVEDRAGHDFRYSVDDSKIRLLGYAPMCIFEDSLAEVVSWYRENEDWWIPTKLLGTN
jgi:dTDP-glucose 4,6-dehydratase